MNDDADSSDLLSEKILSLIFRKRYDEAKELIDAERKRLPEQEHRLLALSATLHERVGNIDKSIALMRQALKERPDWLPHLYQLSVMLMDAEHWEEADVVLKEAISLSQAKNDAYFLGECRFRRAVCLHALRRSDELEQAKAQIPADLSIFIGDGLYRIDDLIK